MLETISIVTSIVAVIVTLALGAISIWLSFQFYDRGKTAHGAIQSGVDEIKTQADFWDELLASIWTS